MPAPSAAATPRRGCGDELCDVETNDNSRAPLKMMTAPPTTPTQRSQPARRSSRKKRIPHAIPIKLLEFHSGKAILRPMSRTPKMVKVLPTAQRQPAKIPHRTRWGAWRTSLPISEVPRISAGRLQREMNAPRTIMKEMMRGETAMVTSLVGASAAASHSAAAIPQNIPSAESVRWRARSVKLPAIIDPIGLCPS